MRQIYGITVDEFKTAYISFEPSMPGISKRQIHVVKDSIIVDLGDDGRIVGVEILDPEIVENLFSPTVGKLFETYNIERAVS